MSIRGSAAGKCRTSISRLLIFFLSPARELFRRCGSKVEALGYMAKRKRGGGGGGGGGGGRYRDNNNRQGGGGGASNRGPGQGRRGRGGGGRGRRPYGQQTDRQDRNPEYEPHDNGEQLPLVAGSGALRMDTQA